MKFRKKPVEIEASRWYKNGDHPDDYTAGRHEIVGSQVQVISGEEAKEKGWEGDVVRYFRSPTVPGTNGCRYCDKTMHDHGWIDTLEGGHIVCPGDWIITGVNGERYPCKPDIFAKTYDAA